MSLILDGTNGLSDVDGSAATPAIRGSDANTGVFFGADIIGFSEGGTECARFNADAQFVAAAGTALLPVITTTGDVNTGIFFPAADTIAFAEGGAEAMRIDSSGNLLVGQTSNDAGVVGHGLQASGFAFHTRAGGTPLAINRLTNDGDLVHFSQASILEGAISVSGSTVTYGGGHLARWGQLLDGSKDESLKKGTVLSNLDEMCVWSAPTTYWTEEDELPVDAEGNSTVAVGDVKKEAFTADNEQCNKIKVSDVEGDANVAGVFVSWTYDEQFNSNDLFVAMTGDMIIRIAEGVTIQRGDLLMSAGDGTAKPQGDDIVRSKTIAKVTSTHVTCTYADGSFCVPCVLMAC
jgi:hypothetical protein